MTRHSFIQMPKLSNVKGRISYITSHARQENLYATYRTADNSPNSFLHGLPRSIINQFDFHNFLCLCLASVHLPYPFHLVSAFSFSVTPFRFANSGTISSMRFRAASSILAQYCLTYTQQWRGIFFALFYFSVHFQLATSGRSTPCSAIY